MGTQDGPGNIVSVEFEVFGQVQVCDYLIDNGRGSRLVATQPVRYQAVLINKDERTATNYDELKILNTKSCFLLVKQKIMQGVFFRKNTVLRGRELGLRGWCMNTSEGTVRGAMEGQAGKVAEMKYWLQNTSTSNDGHELEEEMKGADVNERKNNGSRVSRRKKFVLCSGYSSKSLLIISRVHSNTASNILGTSLVMFPSNLLTIMAMADSTSGSRADGTAVRW
uniref:acylphosphatase n=1 Tax=Timema bartmani TaxID=61472 RepID=A0A7R9HW95_9NEOP|nr:unnamed protein product [Timema bartmani]